MSTELLSELNDLFARRATTPLPAPLHLPAGAHPRVDYPAQRPLEDVDREYLLDLAAAARGGAYDLCGSTDLVERICAEMCDLDSERRLAQDDLEAARAETAAIRALHLESRDQIQLLTLQLEAARGVASAARQRLGDEQRLLAAEQAEVLRLGRLHARISAENAELRSREIARSLERLSVTVTNQSSTDVTAALNEHVRSGRIVDCGRLYEPDVEVVDVDTEVVIGGES